MFPLGLTKQCPLTVQLRANHSLGTTLAQFGSKCYEVVQTKVSWLHAENNCLSNEAQLVDIRSQEEQDFLFHYLHSISSHTVWLGFHDRNNEEQFQWTSGISLFLLLVLLILHCTRDINQLIPLTAHFSNSKISINNIHSKIFLLCSILLIVYCI